MCSGRSKIKKTIIQISQLPMLLELVCKDGQKKLYHLMPAKNKKGMSLNIVSERMRRTFDT